MSSPSKTYWSINSAVFPRNPDNWTKKHNASNVSYVTMADGTTRRIVVPFKINPAPVELEWHYADERLRNFVFSKLNQDLLYKVTVDGKLPARQIWMYFDTPEENMSKDAYDSRVGQGGMRSDLKITGMMDGPYQHSANVVPLTKPTAAQMQTWFGGPTGNNAYDLLPTWNGASYNSTPVLSSGAFNSNIAFTNMGTAPWSPTIRVNGPFNNGMQITLAYQDVDGTGQGVVFTYTGPNVASGDYLLIDTQKMRVYSVVSGAQNEIFTFTLLTVANSTPFSYWPPFPTGNFNVKWNVAGGTQGTTTLDLSNNGTETFRYW